MKLNRSFPFFLAVGLTACGGSVGVGGNGNTGTDITGIYSTQPYKPNAQDARQQLIQQGLNGKAWVSTLSSYEDTANFAELFVYSSLRPVSVFQYELETEPATFNDLLVRLNQLGSQGFAWKGAYSFGQARYSAYVRDTTKSASYTYVSKPGPINTSLADLLAQLNAEGAKGYTWLGTYASSAAPNAFANIYVKDSSDTATFSYSAIALATGFAPANQADLLAKLQQGAVGGAHYLSTLGAGGQYAMLFEKPSGKTQPTQYAVTSITAGEPPPYALTSINYFAAHGNFYWGDMATMDGNLNRIYVAGAIERHPLYGIVYP